MIAYPAQKAILNKAVIDLNPKIDILDRLQEVNGYVRLVMASGEVIFGRPQCIVYDEDDEGWETVKTIMFEPWNGIHPVFFTEEEIESFDEWKKDEIPPVE